MRNLELTSFGHGISSIDNSVDRAPRAWPRGPTDATYFSLQLKCGAVRRRARPLRGEGSRWNGAVRPDAYKSASWAHDAWPPAI